MKQMPHLNTLLMGVQREVAFHSFNDPQAKYPLSKLYECSQLKYYSKAYYEMTDLNTQAALEVWNKLSELKPFVEKHAAEDSALFYPVNAKEALTEWHRALVAHYTRGKAQATQNEQNNTGHDEKTSPPTKRGR